MKPLILTLILLLLAALAYAQSVVSKVELRHTDALGRTQTATATLDHFVYDGAPPTPTLYVWLYSDQLFCSAFGGN